MEHQFDLRHLAALTALADELHFGRAATRLHLAQSALSRTIQQLERSLDCQLVDRTTRSVSLTPAGAELAMRARELLAATDQAARRTLDVAAGRAGRLRVGFTGPALSGPLPGLLRRFQADQPSWRLDLVELPSTEQIERLVDGELDVGFFLAGPRIPRELDHVEVTSERSCVGVAIDHPLGGRSELALRELAGERLILFPRDRNPGLYDEIVDLVTDGHTRRVEIQHASSRLIAASLVAAGLGVSTFTESMTTVCGPDVVLIPQVRPERTTTLVMGWDGRRRNPLLDAIEIGRSPALSPSATA
ncbi:MAG: LysR family transcriptional regulator [Ilumatobacter sp.]|uniref:LysR family transcriptional regulator n=1 Tax=Ilumatobacter sp. TaxID=1967498 RepID=UPI0026385233|nr:LysR family transcriptional regulator [Ilumatobacter sp.]MDJ0769773.1 LysR family transcriptional regulator [Ilumatobacter sp.]